MLEPLSSLAIAATVVQFADATTKLFSTTREIYLAGFTKGNEDLGILVKDILDVYEQLKRNTEQGSSSKPSNEDQNLISIVNSCISIGNDLQARLRKLNPSYTTAQRRFGRSLRQALRVSWHQNEILDLQKRLDFYRQQADSHILTSLHNVKVQEKKDRAQAIAQLSQDHKKLVTQLNRQHGDIISKFKVIDEKLSLHGESLRQYVQMQMKEIHRLLQNPASTFFSANSKETEINQVAGNFNSEEMGTGKGAYYITYLIVTSLYYPRSNERMRTVAKNHRDTFRWIFRPDNYRRFSAYSNGNFSRWLKRASGCFCISGKPGSGKSTLMRFICTSSETFDALCGWADGLNLVVSSFFYWRAGTDLQKLLVGMLRTIVHDILLVYPELARAVFPELTAHLEKHPQTPCADFTLNELKEALRSLASIAQTGTREVAPFKICLFIDGIDESTEDPTEIAQLLRDISNGSSVAIIVSGRPDQGCEAIFDDAPRLRVQDLTRPDIQKYVTDSFEENTVVKRLDEDEKIEIQHLVHQIIDEADGVFLWVELIVKSLLEGIRHGDTVQDLHDRFAELPKDLQKLYDHMLSEVNPRYRQEACRFFVVYREMTKRFPSLYLTPLSLRVLSLNTEKYKNWINDDWSCAETATAKFEALTKKVEARIRSRSRGLLEVRNMIASATGSEFPSVQLLHRTLAEFLFQPSQWNQLEKQANLAGSELDKCLSRMLLIRTKEMLQCDNSAQALESAHALMVHARKVESSEPSHDPQVTEQILTLLMHDPLLGLIPRSVVPSLPQNLGVSNLSAALGFCETTLAFTRPGDWALIAELLSWMCYAQRASSGTLSGVSLQIPVCQRFLQRYLNRKWTADFDAYARTCLSMLSRQISVSKIDLEVSWSIALSGYMASSFNPTWDDIVVTLVNFGPNLFTGVDYNGSKRQYTYELLPQRIHTRITPKIWEQVKSIGQIEDDWQMIEAFEADSVSI